MSTTFKFNLEAKATDSVTGLTGIIIYRVDFITGCNQYGVMPALGKDGKLDTKLQFDENRLVIDGKKKGEVTTPIFKHDLGIKAEDVVTGFSGVVVWRAEHIGGRLNYGIQPPLNEDGRVPEDESFDEGRLRRVGTSKVKLPENKEAKLEDKGGPNYLVKF